MNCNNVTYSCFNALFYCVIYNINREFWDCSLVQHSSVNCMLGSTGTSVAEFSLEGINEGSVPLLCMNSRVVKSNKYIQLINRVSSYRRSPMSGAAQHSRARVRAFMVTPQAGPDRSHGKTFCWFS